MGEPVASFGSGGSSRAENQVHCLTRGVGRKTRSESAPRSLFERRRLATRDGLPEVRKNLGSVRATSTQRRLRSRNPVLNVLVIAQQSVNFDRSLLQHCENRTQWPL